MLARIARASSMSVSGGIQNTGDEALTALTIRFHAFFFRLAYVIVGREDLAEDVIQDCLLRIREVASTCHAETDRQAYAWLKRVVVTHALNVCKKERVRTRQHTYFHELHPQEEAFDQLDSLEHTEELQLVQNAMKALHEKYRAVLELRFIKGYEYAAIATELGCTEASARKRTQRSLQQLRKRVGRTLSVAALCLLLRRLQASSLPIQQHVVSGGSPFSLLRLGLGFITSLLIYVLVWGLPEDVHAIGFQRGVQTEISIEGSQSKLIGQQKDNKTGEAVVIAKATVENIILQQDVVIPERRFEIPSQQNNWTFPWDMKKLDPDDDGTGYVIREQKGIDRSAVLTYGAHMVARCGVTGMDIVVSGPMRGRFRIKNTWGYKKAPALFIEVEQKSVELADRSLIVCESELSISIFLKQKQKIILSVAVEDHKGQTAVYRKSMVFDPEFDDEFNPIVQEITWTLQDGDVEREGMIDETDSLIVKHMALFGPKEIAAGKLSFNPMILALSKR